MPPPTSHEPLCDAPDWAQPVAPAHLPIASQSNNSGTDAEANLFNPQPKRDHLNYPIDTPTRPGGRDEAWLKAELPRLSRISPKQRKGLETSSKSFIDHQAGSTPINPKVNEELKEDPKVDDQKALVEVELGKFIEQKDEGAWAKSLYSDLVDQSEIRLFLEETTFYSQDRWVTIPASADDLLEEELYTPYVRLINLLLKRFVLRKGKQGVLWRKAIDTHSKPLAHQELHSTIRWSRPDVSVKAQGPSFQKCEPKRGKGTPEVGFSNMSSFMEMKVESQDTSLRDQVLQVGVYARQIFIQQPNRQFVRALLLTENSVRLFHFDRSGVMYTPFIDIHKDPYTFIRLVVGLNSLDESALGLDTSIQWRVKGGRKVGGTLTAVTADNTKIKYQLSKVDPVATLHDIRGRATQCWEVSDPKTGVYYLVKDCWRAEDRVPEHVYLEDARGLPGVVQMISFESNRAETRHFRGDNAIDYEGFHNRVATRTVMDSYGPSIEEFRSVKELLYALRDAINGHMHLNSKSIVHRDVSINNIVLGRKDLDTLPEPGFWGVLIDLHMAIKSGRPSNEISIDWRTVSRMYQSMRFLLNCEDSSSVMPAQNHLDDMESFFYVYTHILYKYDSEGNKFRVEDEVACWALGAAKSVAAHKRGFIFGLTLPSDIAKRWPKPCITLFYRFRRFIAEMTPLVVEFDWDGEASIGAEQADAKMSKVIQHYDKIFYLFDEAIEALEAEEDKATDKANARMGRFPTPDPDPQTPTKAKKTVAFQRSDAQGSLKRGLEEYPDELPVAKRNHDTAYVRPEGFAEFDPETPAKTTQRVPTPRHPRYRSPKSSELSEVKHS
ncbi:hypothetical protein MD484_g6319, partial [Candolleomyces efflorescens]